MDNTKDCKHLWKYKRTIKGYMCGHEGEPIPVEVEEYYCQHCLKETTKERYAR